MTLSRRSVTSDLCPAHLSFAVVDLFASGISRLEHQISSLFEPYRDERATVRIYEWWRRQEAASQPLFPHCIFGRPP
jgi:hypothetical protein